MVKKSAVTVQTDAKAKKFAMLQKVCSEIQGKFGKESVNFLGNNKIEPIPRLKSGSNTIDKITGGGYPLGRIIELFGGESSGKTTACYHAIAEAQKAFPDKWCGFVDSEYGFDAGYAQAIGVQVDELVVAQPDSGTDAFAMVQSFIENGAALVVVDSVAAMVPREEVEEDDYGKSSVGTQARMMSKALRKLTAIVGKSQCVLMFTNQTREKVGVMYGNPTTTSGGKALQFYASIRLKVSKIGIVEEGSGDNKEKTSIRTKFETVKNKTFPPFRVGETEIVFGKGINNDAGVLEDMIESGLIQKKGGWYAIDGANVAQGIVNLKQYLADNPSVYEALKVKLNAETELDIAENQTTAPIDANDMTDDEIASIAENDTQSGEV